MIFTPGKWFYCPTPLPSGISWASDPPTSLEFPIPSMVEVWIFSGTTHCLTAAITTAREITHMGQIFLQIPMFRSINWSLHPTEHMPWIVMHLQGLLCIREAGRRGNKITEHWLNFSTYKVNTWAFDYTKTVLTHSLLGLERTTTP